MSWATFPGYLADYLGHEPDDEHAQAHLDTARDYVRAYTRGNGFDDDGVPAEDLQRVIIAAAARSVSNPEHTESETTGPFSQRPGRFTGWTLPELAVLHRYRRRLA